MTGPLDRLPRASVDHDRLDLLSGVVVDDDDRTAIGFDGVVPPPSQGEHDGGQLATSFGQEVLVARRMRLVSTAPQDALLDQSRCSRCVSIVGEMPRC